MNHKSWKNWSTAIFTIYKETDQRLYIFCTNKRAMKSTSVLILFKLEVIHTFESNAYVEKSFENVKFFCLSSWGLRHSINIYDSLFWHWTNPRIAKELIKKCCCKALMSSSSTLIQTLTCRQNWGTFQLNEFNYS